MTFQIVFSPEAPPQDPQTVKNVPIPPRAFWAWSHCPLPWESPPHCGTPHAPDVLSGVMPVPVTVSLSSLLEDYAWHTPSLRTCTGLSSFLLSTLLAIIKHLRSESYIATDWSHELWGRFDFVFCKKSQLILLAETLEEQIKEQNTQNKWNWRLLFPGDVIDIINENT